MAQLKARRIKKTYLALVQGNVCGGRRPDRGADRARPQAADADGRRRRWPAVDHRLPRPGALRRLDAARARPRHRPDPPDPRPSRRHRPSGRGRPGVRRPARRDAARTASTACSCTPGGSSCIAADGHLIRADRAAARRLESVLDGLARGGRAAAVTRRDRLEPTIERRRLGRPGRRGAPGADARHHLGPERASGRTRSSTRCASGRTTAAHHYVVTCTTRAPRPGEVDGVDYHFLDRERFLRPARRRRPARGERGPRQLVRHAARRRSATRSPPARTSSSRSTSRAPRTSRSRWPRRC